MTTGSETNTNTNETASSAAPRTSPKPATDYSAPKTYNRMLDNANDNLTSIADALLPTHPKSAEAAKAVTQAIERFRKIKTAEDDVIRLRGAEEALQSLTATLTE